MTGFDLVLDEARVVTPSGVLERSWVGVSGGEIAAIGSGPCTETAHELHHLGGAWLGPGFIDVHTHGSMGIDVMNTDAEGLRTLARFFATKGVTSFLVGTTTHDRADTLRALDAVKESQGAVDGGADILGAYMEGPFLNPVRKGAHPENLLRPIDRDEMGEFLASGVVRAVALAPELDDSEWLIRELVGRGITAVAGHTDATFAQMAWAQETGVSAVTHAFNGMRGLHHREPGAAGAALLIDELACEVIADGVHLAPELLKLFWRMKGARRIALITDAGAFGGMPDGDYDSLERSLVVEGGVGRLPDGTIASSAKTFDHNFVLFCEYTGAAFDEAWPAASETAARIAGVSDRKGIIEVGKDADLAVLTPEGRVVASVVGGRWIQA
jgi:N-acetylglucosamine-6-phosphate deacetylase